MFGCFQTVNIDIEIGNLALTNNNPEMSKIRSMTNVIGTLNLVSIILASLPHMNN